MFAVILLLMTVACGHSHEEISPRAAALSDSVWDARYKSVDQLGHYARELDAVAGENMELQTVAGNAAAYAAMMQMDYHEASALYENVKEESECEIENLVADVGMMILCYRVSENRRFFDYRAKASLRIDRIEEESALLSQRDRKRFIRAKLEYSIVSISYFSNLGMENEKDAALAMLEENIAFTDDRALQLYGGMILLNNEADSKKRLKGFCHAIEEADEEGYTWISANYRLLLAISLRSEAAMERFKKILPECYAALKAGNNADDGIAAALAADAADGFAEYGDMYMMIEALSVTASCETEYGRYGVALETLDEALGLINGYYSKYYPDEKALAENTLEGSDSAVYGGDDNVYYISECLLSVRKELSACFSGMDSIMLSNVNRNEYLDFIYSARQSKELESRYHLAEEYASELSIAIVISVILLLAAVAVAVLRRMRNLKRRRDYSENLSLLQVTCRNLISSLPRDVDSKEELCKLISYSLNGSLCNFSGDTSFSLLSPPENAGGSTLYEFTLQYVGGGEDSLYVLAGVPLTAEKLSMLSMLVPYVAVAVEEGMRLSHISDEKERVKEELDASSIYLAEHKRENLLKRVSVSVVIGMRPFMDRILHELEALSAPMTGEDEERKLKYIEELTDKLDGLNLILERWIKMRQGDLNLQVENFMIADIFSIIEKSRLLLERKGINLAIGESASVVKADKALTLFMVNTLVENASKFTPAGGTVTLESREGDGYVEIAVADTGIGMSQDDIDRILGEKVYDASSIGKDNELLKPKSKGGGFGLMNCKGIIDKYRKTDAIFSVCSMNIESSKGKGSRFSFRLPKGVMRLVLLLLVMLPVSVSANEDILDRVTLQVDSVYECNVNGDYEGAIMHAGSALRLINEYYRAETGGNDTLSLASGPYNELEWWNKGVFRDAQGATYEKIYYNLCSMRNEVAVAALAMRDWSMSRYNNHIYTILFRYINDDNSLSEDYRTLETGIANSIVVLAFVIFILVITVLYIIISYVNYSIIGKKNERMLLDVNRSLIDVTADKVRLPADKLLQRFADSIYVNMSEGMRIRTLSIMLCKNQDGSNALVATAGEGRLQYRNSVFLSGVISSGEPYISPDGLVRVFPIYAASADETVMVGAMELVCSRPLAGNEVLNLELVADYAASVIYHSIIRVASSYMALEEMEEAVESMRLEENRLHVQNQVLDNCLSVIKHETIYYPSRIRELARQALASKEGRKGNVASMHEYMSYYNTIFGILSNCAKRELDDNSFMISSVTVDSLFAGLSQYIARRSRKLGLDIELVHEPSGLSVSVDRDMVSYLLELLADAAMKVDRPGKLHIRAVSAGDSVRVELTDNRRELSSEEAAELFVPTHRNLAEDGSICGMEYLVAKEVIRVHEDKTGRRGSRIEARTDAAGTVILFTLPK